MDQFGSERRDSISITPAQSRDEPAIKHLLADCGLPGDDITAAHLEHFLVHKENSRLIGVVGLEQGGKDALLRSLAVSEDRRGRGLARALVGHAERQARAAGVESLYLLTTTADEFFAALGYRVTQRDSAPKSLQETAEFAGLCPASSVCMVKRLGTEK